MEDRGSWSPWSDSQLSRNSWVVCPRNYPVPDEPFPGGSHRLLCPSFPACPRTRIDADCGGGLDVGEASFPAPEAHVISESFRILERTVAEKLDDSGALGGGWLVAVLLPVDEGVGGDAELRCCLGNLEAAVHAGGADVIA